MPSVLQVNALGVPPLANGQNITLPQLLLQDTFVQQGQVTQQWGVFLNGAPALTFDTFVSIDYRHGWVLSDYPVERGGFQTYDKVQLPFDVRVKFAAGGAEDNRISMLSSTEQVARSLLLYDVVTPEKIFTSVNVQHIDFRRTATNGLGLITVEMWLLEVRVTVNDSSSNTGINNEPVDAAGNPVPQTNNPVAGNGNNTAAPSGADPVSGGNVSPIPVIPGFDTGSGSTAIGGAPF